MFELFIYKFLFCYNVNMNSLVFIFAISLAIIIDLVKFIFIVLAFVLLGGAVTAPAAPFFYGASKVFGVLGSIYSAAFIILYSGILKYKNNKNATKIIKKTGAKVATRVGASSIAGLIPIVDVFPWCCYSIYTTCRDREKLDAEMNKLRANNS